MSEIHIRSKSDVMVVIAHENLVENLIGFAREGTNEYGSPGVLIFIPTGSGETLLDLMRMI